jgi:hypothetical protein
MSRHRRPPSSSSDSDERIGRKVEEELSSSSEDDVRNKPQKKKATIKPRNRLPISRRTEIIQNKMRGIDDPEFCCTQNPKNKSWTVRRRKFPLDQTIRHEAPIEVKKEVVVEEKKEPVKEEKKEDLELSWANMQASHNDGLAKQLAELSSKFDKISEKYEEKKKAKAKPKPPKPKPKPQPKETEYEYYSDDEPAPPPPRPATAPRQTPPPMAQQRQLPQRLPVGVYRRAGPLSINQF